MHASLSAKNLSAYAHTFWPSATSRSPSMTPCAFGICKDWSECQFRHVDGRCGHLGFYLQSNNITTILNAPFEPKVNEPNLARRNVQLWTVCQPKHCPHSSYLLLPNYSNRGGLCKFFEWSFFIITITNWKVLIRCIQHNKGEKKYTQASSTIKGNETTEFVHRAQWGKNTRKHRAQ